MKIFNSIILLFLLAQPLSAQDIHFSAWEEMPFIMNPAYTGSIHGNYKNRATTAHRKQWNAALGRADYETYYAAYDHKLSFCDVGSGAVYLGLGFDMYHDHVGQRLGESIQFYEHNSVRANLAFGYVPSQRLSLIAGLNIGWLNYGIDDGNLTFDNQFGYVGGSQYDYNPALASGEEFLYTNINYVDIGAGFLISGSNMENFHYEGGVSFLHLNDSKKKFLANSNDRELIREYRVHGKLGIDLNRNKRLNVLLAHYKYGGFFGRDGQQWQFNTRLEFATKINRSNEFLLAAGSRISNLDGRGINPDAIILGIKWRPYLGQWESNAISNTTLGITYDMNISPHFARATNTMGAIEFYLSFAFGKDNKVCCKTHF